MMGLLLGIVLVFYVDEIINFFLVKLFRNWVSGEFVQCSFFFVPCFFFFFFCAHFFLFLFLFFFISFCFCFLRKQFWVPKVSIHTQFF